MSLPITRYRYRALDASVLIGAEVEARIYRNFVEGIARSEKIHGWAGVGDPNVALLGRATSQVREQGLALVVARLLAADL